MDTQKPPKLRMGQAIFLKPESCLWDIRQATKQAMLDKQPPQEFIVAHEEQYYPRILNQFLAQSTKLAEEAFSLGEAITGCIDGCLRCAALWDMGTQDGILLHRDGATLLCAYIPVLSPQIAHDEHALSMRLAALAHEVGDTPIHLDKGIGAGRQSIQAILHYLSEQIDI